MDLEKEIDIIIKNTKEKFNEFNDLLNYYKNEISKTSIKDTENFSCLISKISYTLTLLKSLEIQLKSKKISIKKIIQKKQ
jgi:hypothetical protein